MVLGGAEFRVWCLGRIFQKSLCEGRFDAVAWWDFEHYSKRIVGSYGECMQFNDGSREFSRRYVTWLNLYEDVVSIPDVHVVL